MSYDFNCTVCFKIKNVISCNYCSYSTCTDCTKKYLCSLNRESHCMNCRKPWSYSYLESILPKTFLHNEYRDHQEQLLFESEKRFFEKTKESIIYKEKIEKIDSSITEITSQISKLHKQLAELKTEKKELFKKMCNTTSSVLLSCPLPNCKGVLQDNTCLMCSFQLCPFCSKEKISGHECKEEDIQTVNYVNESSKSCPSCGIKIIKSSGCDHMWCTCCHTSFSWNTLEIGKKILQNPHYYEYLAQSSVSLRCDDNVMIDNSTKEVLTQYIAELNTSNEKKDLLYYRLVYLIKIREVSLPTIPKENEFTHKDLRMRFLRDEIDEAKFKSSLYLDDKKNRIMYELRQLLETYLLVASDLFRSLKTETIDDFFTQENSLREYTNEHIIKLNSLYHVKCSLLL